jgi:hypothetical protein
MSNLKRCPCCKGKAEFIKGTCELDNYVMCLECKLRTKSHNTKEGAIKAWNTRKPLERILERFETEKNREKPYSVINLLWNRAIKIVKEEGGL